MLTESCWQLSVISSKVKWSVSGRQRANGSVLCDMKRASALLILLYRAVELCEVVLTAPDRPHSQSPGPSLSGTLFSLSFLSGRVKEDHCVRHTPAFRTPTTNPVPPALLARCWIQTRCRVKPVLAVIRHPPGSEGSGV